MTTTMARRGTTMKLMLATVALATACGGNAAPSLDAPDAVSVPTTTAVEAAAPDATELPVPIPGRALSAVRSVSPSPLGWELAPGRWTSDVFDVPLTFETSYELALRAESDGLLVFMNPEMPDARTLLMITRAAAVPGTSGAELPPSAAIDELRQALENQPTVEINDEGTLGPLSTGAAISWWDFVVADYPDAHYPCWLGFGCVELAMTTGGDRMSTRVDAPTRLYFLGPELARYRAYVVGDEEGFDAMTAIADELISSLEFGDEFIGPAVPAAETIDLRSIGLRRSGIPAGDYATLLGDTLVEVTSTSDLEGVALTISGDETLLFVTASGFLTIFDPSKLISPSADQTRLMAGEYSPQDLLTERPNTIDEFDAWIREIYNVTDSGREVVAGEVAGWWDSEQTDTNSGPCLDEAPGDFCTKHAFTDYVFHWTVDDSSPSGDSSDELFGRRYFLPEAGVVLEIGTTAESPESPDVVLDELAPLLEAIILTRLG